VSIATSARIAVGVLAVTIAVRPVGAQQQQQPAVRVPTAVLERYVGEYVYPNGATVMIRLKGDTLFREVPGQRVVLWPISETMFQMGPVFTAEFVIDQAGGVTQVVTDGVDIEHRLPRKASGAAAPPAPRPTASPAPAAAAVRVPRSVLERYVGVYEFVPGQMKRTDLRVMVRLKGDTLTRWMGSKEVVLTPLSATRFKVGSTSLVTEFVIDEGGVMQVMGSGNQQMLARLRTKS
jgi:hypothetical protein